MNHLHQIIALAANSILVGVWLCRLSSSFQRGDGKGHVYIFLLMLNGGTIGVLSAALLSAVGKSAP